MKRRQSREHSSGRDFSRVLTLYYCFGGLIPLNVLRISSRFHPAHSLLRDRVNAEKMRRFHAVGGMQLQVYLLTRTLAQQGIQQDVVTVHPPWEPRYEEREGVRI